MRKIMAALDVGTKYIKLVVGEMIGKKLNVLATAETTSCGVKNGILEDADSILEPLQYVIHKCEETIGLSIREVILSIPANDAKYMVVSGDIDVNNESNTVEGKDVIKVINRSLKSVDIDEEYEIVSMLPTGFVLDNERKVKDPKGLNSKTLGVRGVLVTTPKKNIYPIVNALKALNVDVLDITLSSIGDYYEFKNDKLDSNIGVVINLGSSSVTISIFNKGILVNSEVLNNGGDYLDKDIAYIYKINTELARKIKEEYAVCDGSLVNNSDATIYDETYGDIKVNQGELSKIAISRLEEIFNLCKKEINNLTKKEISYIIITGGLARIKEVSALFEDIFDVNTKVGNIFEIGARNNMYSTCLGLIKYYASGAKLKDKDYSIFSIEEQQLLGADLNNENKIGKLFGEIFNG